VAMWHNMENLELWLLLCRGTEYGRYPGPGLPSGVSGHAGSSILESVHGMDPSFPPTMLVAITVSWMPRAPAIYKHVSVSDSGFRSGGSRDGRTAPISFHVCLVEVVLTGNGPHTVL
jgi:hypothetical protein